MTSDIQACEIPLTNGGVALCDPMDYLEIAKHRWFKSKDHNMFYAMRAGGTCGRLIRMHCQIMGIMGIDHKNGCGLDNRRDNLRPATASQNGMNRGKFTIGHSKFKGVTWNCRDKRWTARIKVAGRRLNLGQFTSETAAALSYNNAALIHFGEFARINQL